MKKITKKLFNPDLYKASDTIDRILKANPAFGHRHRMFLPHGYGACVSSFCTFKILQFMNSSAGKGNAVLVLRQHEENIRESLEVFKWAIEFLECTDDFEISRHNRRIKQKRTGATVYFRGLDGRPVFQQKGETSICGPVRILLFEEAHEFNEDDVDNLTVANLFAGEGFKNSIALFSFNTPSDYGHWLNGSVLGCQQDMRREGLKSRNIAYRSDYRHVPKEWLGEWFFEHARALKKINNKIYKNIYLGLPTEE